MTQSSGGGAPSDATFVTLSVNATLTNERVLTGTANQITITDNGAGSTVVLSLPQSIATSSTPTFASMTLTGASSLTLGTASSATGAIILKNSTNANNTVLQAGAAGATLTFTLPTTDGDNGDVLTTNGSGVMSWAAAGSGANTALSNLASVALNTALLPDAAAADDFGSATLPFKDIFLAGSSGTPATNNFQLTGTSTSGTRVITLPDATGTVALTSDIPAAGANTALSNLAAVAINTTLLPGSDDGAALGSGTFSFSDLFLASGGVVNFDDGDMTITHSANTLTVAGGTIALGVATATTLNGLTVTASTGTLTITDAKTLSVSNTLTLAGTDSTTMTFPTTSATIARTDAGQTFTGRQLLAASASVGYAVGGADATFTGITISGTAGAALAFGDLISLDPTDSRWELADANAASGADGDSRGILGICVLAANADGDPTTILLNGVVRGDTAFPSMTVNAPMYVSETAGDITGTAPTTTDAVVRAVGYALTADELYFAPWSGFQTAV